MQPPHTFATSNTDPERYEQPHIPFALQPNEPTQFSTSRNMVIDQTQCSPSIIVPLGVTTDLGSGTLMQTDFRGQLFMNSFGEAASLSHVSYASRQRIDVDGMNHATAHSQLPSMQGSQLQSYNGTDIPQNDRFENHTFADATPWFSSSPLLGGPTAVPPMHNATNGHEVIPQGDYSYVLQFSRDRYAENYAPFSIDFGHRAALPGQIGVAIGLLLRRHGATKLSQSHVTLHLPDDVAATITLWILIPGCKKFSKKIHMRRKVDRVPITIADLAARIANIFKAFLKKEPDWAAENAPDLNKIILTRFYRVSKGSWQIELGTEGAARGASPTLGSML